MADLNGNQTQPGLSKTVTKSSSSDSLKLRPKITVRRFRASSTSSSHSLASPQGSKTSACQANKAKSSLGSSSPSSHLFCRVPASAESGSAPSQAQIAPDNVWSEGSAYCHREKVQRPGKKPLAFEDTDATTKLSTKRGSSQFARRTKSFSSREVTFIEPVCLEQKASPRNIQAAVEARADARKFPKAPPPSRLLLFRVVSNLSVVFSNVVFSSNVVCCFCLAVSLPPAFSPPLSLSCALLFSTCVTSLYVLLVP